jgi:hypothetical protein
LGDLIARGHSMSRQPVDNILHQWLLDVRGDAASVEDFRSWFALNQSKYEHDLPAGLMLKLKRGDAEQVMAAIARLLPACDSCQGIFPEGPFNSRQDHSSCSSMVNLAVSNGVFIRKPMPIWIKPDASHRGADAYFSCARCGALWTMVDPEREDRGFWARLA